MAEWTHADRKLLARLLAEQQRRDRCKSRHYFPDCTPECRPNSRDPAHHAGFCRVLYRKHMEFFAAGVRHDERLFMAANQVGKTEGCGFETGAHATGQYPHWWQGRKFQGEDLSMWCAGNSMEATRDILQVSLFGPISGVKDGLLVGGFIPHNRILDMRLKPGAVSYCIHQIWIRQDERHHGAPCVTDIEFKCLVGGTPVQMSDASWRPIEDVEVGHCVATETGAQRVIETHSYASAPTLHIATRSGELTMTPNHRVPLSDGSWKQARELVAGDVIGLSRSPAPDDEHQADWRVKLTALMIGDGCTRGRTPFFTCNEPPIVEMVRNVLPADLRVVRVRNTISYKIASVQPNRNRLTDSLRADGLWGKLSKVKHIPQWVFRLPAEQRVDFLRWLWGCDGTITEKMARYDTASRRLADDVRRLLWSVGIHAPVRQRTGGKYPSWYVALHGKNRVIFQSVGKLNRDVVCTVTPRPKGPPGEVVAITPGLDRPVYCLTVDGGEFIADGFRTGNSYDQGRKLFQGTKKHLIWLDEEPPDPPVSTDSAEDNDIYTECLMRTINCDGIMIMSYTPMKGNTPFTDQYLDSASMIDVDGREAKAHQVLFGKSHDDLLAEISTEAENLRLKAEIEELHRKMEVLQR